ncbi:Wzz/FepE/Etk N-terminal domain-containing protein [Polaribacter tangerinus]|uniref:Wzz/FepE/Etk N-terminal domain-containing protein n=1 Tax=Polaribacter tangerinus TaxID=1920034 RepID=UPI000B4BD1F6|nr:Wzz/FepE/Etk N-terminal domain-containing protein [Polaribacter tangerinus]
MNQELNKNRTPEEDAIDIIALLKQLWVARKLILKITTIFFCIGLFVAVFSKNEYTASTTFVPLAQGKSAASGLGGLASLAGINLGGAINNTEISPELYPKIINSVPFQLEMLHTPISIESNSKKVSYKEFYKTIYRPGVLATLKKYTIGLPGLLLSSLKKDEQELQAITNAISKDQIVVISNEDYKLIKVLEKQLNLEVNAKEGFVAVSFTFSEPKASAELALKAQQLLQKYALKFKTQKATEQLNYITQRYTEKQQEFEQAKLQLAQFQDRNSGLNTALGRTKLMQLQAEYDLIFSVYSELAKQQETQQLQVKQDTPLFTVLKPVTIPKEKSAPKKTLIIIIYIFLGLVMSVGYSLIKEPLKNILQEIRNAN